MNPKMRSEVGKGATSILEGMLEDYIVAFIVNGEYVGNEDYLAAYDQIRSYNRKEIK